MDANEKREAEGTRQYLALVQQARKDLGDLEKAQWELPSLIGVEVALFIAQRHNACACGNCVPLAERYMARLGDMVKLANQMYAEFAELLKQHDANGQVH